MRGVENVPAEGPVLLVGNHNGALLPSDGLFTSLAIWDRFGPRRPVYALVPYLPLPAQTTLAFGPPMTWPEVSAREADDPGVLDRCYAEVEAKMQSMLDELYEGRRPFLGKGSRTTALPRARPRRRGARWRRGAGA